MKVAGLIAAWLMLIGAIALLHHLHLIWWWVPAGAAAGGIVGGFAIRAAWAKGQHR